MDTIKEKSSNHATLTPAKRALLEMRLSGHTPQRAKVQTIEKRPDGSGFPLSFAQQRLWFIYQMAPESVAYNMPTALRLEGILNLPALETAFIEVIRRHEILRAIYGESDGEPVMKINPVPAQIMHSIDLQSLDQAEQETRIKHLVDQEAKQPFDLEKGPLTRIQLLKQSKLEHVLLVTVHHMVCDGWSVGIFVREVAELYDAFISNRVPLLSELPIQYTDFAYWQRQQLQGETLEKKLEYWQQKLRIATTGFSNREYLFGC